MNKMHEYEMKSFSKTLEFNPIFQKQNFQSICPKISNFKTNFALESMNFFFNLGRPQQDHTQ